MERIETLADQIMNQAQRNFARYKTREMQARMAAGDAVVHLGKLRLPLETRRAISKLVAERLLAKK